MKNTLYILVGLLLLGFTLSAQQPVHKRATIAKNSEAYSLQVMNINGDVNIEGYKGTEIEFTANVIRSDNHYTITLKQEGNSTIIYVDGPGVKVKGKGSSWSYNIYTDGKQEVKAHYNFTLRVPDNMVVKASTINKGDVEVRRMNGAIEANNVNGNVRVENVNSQVAANVVNGDIWVQSTKVPAKNTQFNVVNGEIHLQYPAAFNGSVKYNTMQGGFYTDYAYQLGSETTSKQQGKLIKVGNNSVVKIGSGEGARLEVNTINGSIYLKKGN